jgi:hypothetical protein
MRSPIYRINRAKELCKDFQESSKVVIFDFVVRAIIQDLSVKMLTTGISVTDYHFLPHNDIVFLRQTVYIQRVERHESSVHY